MMTKEIKIRPAIETDYQVIANFFIDAYKELAGTTRGLFKPDPEKILWRGTFIDALDNQEEIYLMALVADQPAGFVYATVRQEDEDASQYRINELEINNIFVKPAFRRLGVGRQLVSELTNIMKVRQISDLTALVYEGSPETDIFYQTLGFKARSTKMVRHLTQV